MNNLSLPFKSVAVALLLCVSLGPVGVLYSSTIGAIIMIILGLFVLRAKLVGPIILLWIISCVLSVVCTNHYNKKIINKKN